MKNQKKSTKTFVRTVGAPFVGIHRRIDTTVPKENNEILGGNRFCPYFEKMKNARVGADSISAQGYRGITLIALVITIIILLILAGVVLNLTLGEHGILKKAEQAGEQYKISEIQEKLELEKVDLYARKNGETPSVQEYIDHLINKGIISASDVEEIDANTKNITVEGYVFTISKDGGDIKTTYQGKDTKEPRIAKLQVTGTTVDSISVKVIASNANGANYKYSIKNITAGETIFTVINTLSTNEYTFTGLTINNDYIIQVELVTSEGTDVKETSTIKTEPPKVTSITLDKTNIELVKGGTDTITATVLPENALDKTITWSSSNTDVATVDNAGNIAAVGEGVAIITATSNEVSSVTATCNITVTLPPPPTVGAGGTTHTAKQIQYTWEELNSIAKVISDNYGTTEEGKINNDTAEVNVSINGKADTLGIGDWTTVNGKQVRILGFNHDTLTNTDAYGEGETNTYAGISFEYAECITTGAMNSTDTNTGGWGTCELRGTLSKTTINSLENKEYIKQVSKKYIKTYNNAGSVTLINDKLWLLSCSEIWNDGNKSGWYGYALTKEGERYKYYKNINATWNAKNPSLVKKSNGTNVDWWLRSPNGNNNWAICRILADGQGYGNNASGIYGVAPGFAI